MYTVSVRDHLMIAHSFTGEMFGPAQRLHGATYVVDSSSPPGARRRRHRRRHRPGQASQALLAELNFRNLDEVPVFRDEHDHGVPGSAIFDQIVAAILRGDLVGARAGESVCVTLHESHVAWASFEGPVGDAS